MNDGQESVAIIGLGYVGLPLAVAMAKAYPTIGIDTDAARIDELRAHNDRTLEIDVDRLAASSLRLSTDIEEARGATVIIVTVPTPVDAQNHPDLRAVLGATRSLASILEPGRGTIVVYESTVYPGVTEDICGVEIEKISGLKRGTDFFLGYSPERINPGDREHTVDRIVKVIAGENDAATDRIAAVYGAVTTAGVFRAASIKVAEGAKVIENAQRDINIAFMNEITKIFNAADISIHDVLAAARTKWNFLNFQPGLVGGHCIGVDPFYLSHLAVQVNQHPRIILSGRFINDGMGNWIADRIHEQLKGRCNVLLLGLSFKENVPDIRNSRVVDIARRLDWLGHRVAVHDPLARPEEAMHEYGIKLDPEALETRYQGVVSAVPHEEYRAMSALSIDALVSDGGLIADIKGIWRDRSADFRARYWSL